MTERRSATADGALGDSIGAMRTIIEDDDTIRIY
jgi:hypothetical protein